MRAAGDKDEYQGNEIYSWDLSDPLSASSPLARDVALASAEGKVKWLESFWFPSQRRKNPSLRFSHEGLSTVCIKGEQSLASKDKETSGTILIENNWQKDIATALKKIEIEDLGDMDAILLKESMPEEDSEGRGMLNLQALEKKLSVKIVFCENKHVLLVGQKTKLLKKCFVMRNILSHYHWRLSGKDVSFGTIAARR